MRVLFALAMFVFSLTGCGGSPGEECLKSFQAQLKDPESGRVIDFRNAELTYTATNGYGARIQGKALCRKAGDRWERDRSAELLKILSTTTEVLHAFNACRANGDSTDTCAGNSLALKRTKLDIEALNEESAMSLGY